MPRAVEADADQRVRARRRARRRQWASRLRARGRARAYVSACSPARTAMRSGVRATCARTARPSTGRAGCGASRRRSSAASRRALVRRRAGRARAPAGRGRPPARAAALQVAGVALDGVAVEQRGGVLEHADHAAVGLAQLRASGRTSTARSRGAAARLEPARIAQRRRGGVLPGEHHLEQRACGRGCAAAAALPPPARTAGPGGARPSSARSLHARQQLGAASARRRGRGAAPAC